MRSRRSAAAVVFAVVLGAGACTGTTIPGDDDGGDDGGGDDGGEVDPCADTALSYSNFGEPFMLDWCRGCHSAGVPAGMRQGAPADLNFDTLDQIIAEAPRIAVMAGPATPMMPPAGGPSVEERELLTEWIDCGTQE
jgi:uncharacterized membrane protein